MKIIFSIGKGKLSLATPCFSIVVNATSGRGACLNKASKACQAKSYEGPLPVGMYYINPKELSDPHLIGDLARRTQGDWGDWRIRLHPKPTTKTFGRDNFFLHGGDMKGSAGCIDIGGGVLGNRNTDKILSYIKSSEVKIDVEVTE